MQNLMAILPVASQTTINELVRCRFTNPAKYSVADIFVAVEQGYLSEEAGEKLVARAYAEAGYDYTLCPISYITKDVLDFYKDTKCVPLRVDTTQSAIYVGMLPEDFDENIKGYQRYKIIKQSISPMLFARACAGAYGVPYFLNPIPAADLLKLVVEEALTLDASDITISQKRMRADVYYNVHKKKVLSKRVIPKDAVNEIIKILSVRAGATLKQGEHKPRYFGVDLDINHRGRVVVNQMFYGNTATIRVLENDLFNKELEDLNLSEGTIAFLKKNFVGDTEAGLRIMIGPTMSGKNTTLMACLRLVLLPGDLKGVSVEMPVEILTDFLEQRDCATEDEYIAAVDALRRENPDIVYVTEMMDEVAVPALKVANTGKRVYTSLHANTLAEAISRLKDMTGLSTDRLLLNIHSMVYQVLEHVDLGNGRSTMRPKNRYIRFTDELKDELIGKTEGEVFQILRREERACPC